MRRLPIASLTLLTAAAFCRAEYAPDAEALRITRSEVQRQCAELQLSELQRPALDTLYEDYAREFDEAVAAVDDLLLWQWQLVPDGLQQQDRSIGESVRAAQHSIYRLWHHGARALEQQYFDRLASLAPTQIDHVQRLQRAWERHRVLELTAQDDEAIGCGDVLALLEELELDDDAHRAVQAAIASYEARIEPVIRALDQLRIERRDRFRARVDRTRAVAKDARAKDDPDKQAALAALSDLLTEAWMEPYVLYDQVRALNRQVAGEVMGSLAGPAVSAWTASSSRALLGMEKSDRHLRSLLDRMMRLPDLAPDRRDQIEQCRVALEISWRKAAERIRPLQEECFSRSVKEREARMWTAGLIRRWLGERRADMGEEPVAQMELVRAIAEWDGTVEALQEKFLAEVPEALENDGDVEP